MDVFKVSTKNQKHKHINSKVKVKEPRCDERLGLPGNEPKRPMPDTIFKRNLNKFLLSQGNFCIFIIVLNFNVTHFLEFILEDFLSYLFLYFI